MVAIFSHPQSIGARDHDVLVELDLVDVAILLRDSFHRIALRHSQPGPMVRSQEYGSLHRKRSWPVQFKSLLHVRLRAFSRRMIFLIAGNGSMTPRGPIAAAM
jgi:hypothetical protein